MELNKNLIYEISKYVTATKIELQDPTVEGGTMGLAIFYYYCNLFFNEDIFIEKAESMIEKSIKSLSEITNQTTFKPKYIGDSISNVISSFGKGLLFIENNFNYNFDYLHSEITDILKYLLEKDIERQDYDIFSGALSNSYYFYNKYYHSKCEDLLSKENLKKAYEGTKNSAIYFNENEIYWKAPSYSDKVYLGLSHGSAMMINFWTKLYNLDIIDSNEGIILLDKAVNFIINRKRNFTDGYFPHRMFTNEIVEKTSLSMCYGDLGILYALSQANNILKDERYHKMIQDMLHTTSLRLQEDHLTFDASILYGSAGLSYLFDYFISESKFNISSNTLEYWNKQLLNYKKYHIVGKNNINCSFAWGLSGIGIRLMQLQNKNLPSIKELLLTGI